jgi:hypothetical protein
MEKKVGFCVIYRFRVGPGSERSFKQGWSRMTEAIRERGGGLGSRMMADSIEERLPPILMEAKSDLLVSP